MTMLLDLNATYAGTNLTLVNGAVDTGYSVQREGMSFGAAIEKPMLSRTIDSLGVHITGASIDAREVQIPILVTASSITSLQTKLDAIYTICYDMSHKGGGTIRYRSAAGTYVNQFNVAFAIVSEPEMISEYDEFKRAKITIALTVDPYGFTSPYDLSDGFDTDTFGVVGKYNVGGSDWTAYAGALTNAAVTGGVLDASANLSTTNLFVHIGTPHVYSDVQVQFKHTTGASVTAYQAGAWTSIIGTDDQNGIRAYVDKATDTIRIDKVVAGSASNLANAAITAIAASTDYWITVREENNTIYAEHWLAEPTPLGTPATSTSWTMTTAEAALYGKSVTSRVGISWKPIDTAAAIDDVYITACTYRSWTFPDVLPLNAAWGGTVDVQAGVYFTTNGGTAPVWMMYSWWPKVPAHNFLGNGAGERGTTTGAGTGYNWSVAAVSGVTGAATSVQRTTTAGKFRTGSAALEIVCPATANTGATYAMYRRFRRGVTYTARAWLHASAGTTNARIRLGVSGDISSSTAVALSATWTLHTITWTPTADRDVAYFCAEITAATATTWQVDNAMVFEGTTVPTFEPGGLGPGIWSACEADGLDLATSGAYWTLASDSNYRIGYRMRGSGATANNSYLAMLIRPDLFVPDDFTSGEIDIAVYARCEVASTQAGLSAIVFSAPEGGGAIARPIYTEFRASGKSLKLPSSGTAFKSYYLGTLTFRIDKNNPTRHRLNCYFANSGSATGNFGVDYFVLVPARSKASSRSGASDSVIPNFIGTNAAEVTKLIRSDLSSVVIQEGSTVQPNGGYPDDGIGGEQIMLDRAAAEMLVWPSDQVIDLTDSSSASMAKSHTGTVQVAVQPMHHLFRQS